MKALLTKIFPNNSAGVLRFGYALFGLGALEWLVEFLLHGVSTFPIQLGFSSFAVTGLVAMSAAKQLKNIENRLDKIEKGFSSS